MENLYNLCITAHMGNHTLIVLDAIYLETDVKEAGSVLNVVKQHMPTLKWVLDDGDDKEGTEYCQYASYVDYVKNENYMLAEFTLIKP